LLLNTDRSEAFDITPGDRIAQLLVVALAEIELVESDALDDAVRGTRGFGSSGRRFAQP
jgi:dUTP pyrophosphatase